MDIDQLIDLLVIEELEGLTTTLMSWIFPEINVTYKPSRAIKYQVKSQRVSRPGSWSEVRYWTTLVVRYEEEVCVVLVRPELDEHNNPMLRYLYQPAYQKALVHLLQLDKQDKVSYTEPPAPALVDAVKKLYKVGGEVSYVTGHFESNSLSEINQALTQLYSN
jgi:hypothetical protein